MTAVTWSREGLCETLLGFVDAVFGEFRKENAYITNIFIKSENAGLYHRNFAAFKFPIKSVAKSKDPKLMCYDYDETYSLPSTTLFCFR